MKVVLIVFRKESREMIRDKRVIFGAFVMPVFLIGMMLILFGALDRSLGSQEPQPVAMVGESDYLRKALEASGLFSVEDFPNRALAEEALTGGKTRLALLVPGGIDAAIAERSVSIEALYDGSDTRSLMALRTAQQVVSALNEGIVRQVLERRGVEGSLSSPIKVSPRDVAAEQGLGATFLVGLLPYLIVIWAFYGGISFVSDMVAGEKERGTLETLLVSPAARTHLALGKFWALAAVCLGSSLVSLVAVLIVGVLPLPATEEMFPGGVRLSAAALGSILAVLVPLAAFFAGVLLVVSAVARNMREAQTYLTLVSFLVLMPALVSQFAGLTDIGSAWWANWTPILNAALCIREALMERMDAFRVLVTTSMNVTIAALALAAVVRLFNREQILTRV